jgi:mannose-6-phosphate isomerase-like protein (cupin superfamily)
MYIQNKRKAPRYKNPGITSFLLVSPEYAGSKHIATSLVEIQPGGEQLAHSHKAEQVYFVLEGAGTIHIGDESGKIGRGDCIFIPSGINHGVKNDGLRLLKYITASAPLTDIREMPFRWDMKSQEELEA